MLSVSIVTTTLNRPAFLEQAILSVLEQEYDKSLIEHVIVDASPTRTAEVVVNKFLTGHGVRIKYIHAPETNMPTAVNLGILNATGEIIVILLDDDLLPHNALSIISHYFENDPTLDILCSSVAVMDYDALKNEVLSVRIVPLDFSVHDLLFKTPYEPSKFLRRSAFSKVGPFWERLNIAWQREWLLRAAILGLRCKRTDAVCYVFRRHDLSVSSSLHWVESRRLRWLKEHLLMDRNLIRLARRLGDRDAVAPLERHLQREVIAGIRLSAKNGKLADALFYLLFGLVFHPKNIVAYFARKFLLTLKII